VRRVRWWAAAGVSGLLLSTFMVLQASGARMGGSTANTGNSASAGQLAAPSGLSASADTLICRITLSWTASSTTWASGHKVYRSTSSGGPFALIATVSPRTTTTYADTDAALRAGVNYYYQIRAYYSTTTWLSAWSNTASAAGPAPCL